MGCGGPGTGRLAKVTVQAILTAAVTNLKRLAKLLAPGVRLVPQAA
jgi:hypothetical protein